MPDYDDNLLLGYVEDDLTEAERAQVERWIADDPRLAALLRGMIADRQALRELPQPDAPTWVLDDVDRGLERSMLLQSRNEDPQQVIVRQRHVARRMLVGFAMAALVMLAAGLVIFSIATMNQQPVKYPAPGVPDLASSAQPAQAAPAPAPGTVVAMDQAKPGSIGESDLSARHVNAKREMLKDAPAIASSPSAAPSAPPMGKHPADGIAANTANNAEPLVMKTAVPAVNDDAVQQSDAQPVEVVVQTRDVNSTVAQLNEVARNIPNARLVVAEEPPTNAAAPTESQPLAAKQGPTTSNTPPATSKAGNSVAQADQAVAAASAPAPAKGDGTQYRSAPAKLPETPAPAATASTTTTAVAQQQKPSQQAQQPQQQTASTLNYQLVVPADQLSNAMLMLQAPQFNANQNVALRRQNQLPQLQKRNAAYWPSRSPDYAAILNEQLPARSAAKGESSSSTAPVTAQQAATLNAQTQPPTVTVPIVIEVQPDESHPAVSPPPAPAPNAPAPTPVP